MTKQELNRDCKRLIKDYLKAVKSANYYEILESTILPEFKRIYGADPEAEYLSFDNFKALLRLNLILRVFPLHSFGNKVKNSFNL